MKYQYLESIGAKPGRPAHQHRHRSLGSRVKNCPMAISMAKNIYAIKGLEADLRTFLHNRMFPSGEGWRHRVKKRKLPELENTQVWFNFFFFFFFFVLFYLALNMTFLSCCIRSRYSRH
jgi:hypothetical protein